MLPLSKRYSKILIIMAVTCFTGGSAVFGAGGADWWGEFDAPIKGGVVWTGVASTIFEVVDISRLPAGITPAGSASPVANDVVVKASFTLTLESTVKGKTQLATLSGVAKYTDADNESFNHFYLVRDGQLITAAFVEFLRDQFNNPDSDLYQGAFTNAFDDPSAQQNSNIIGNIILGDGIQPGEPLYSNVRVEIQTP